MVVVYSYIEYLKVTIDKILSDTCRHWEAHSGFGDA